MKGLLIILGIGFLLIFGWPLLIAAIPVAIVFLVLGIVGAVIIIPLKILGFLAIGFFKVFIFFIILGAIFMAMIC